jgi:hypothetical protein
VRLAYGYRRVASHRIRDPVPMEAEGHAHRHFDYRLRIAAEILRIDKACRLGDRCAGAVPADVGANLEVGARGQCTTWRQPRADMVNHSHYEDRLGGRQPARTGDGA